MKLHEIYLSLLQSVGLNADEDGQVYRLLKSKAKRPVTINIDGNPHRLVIPTPAVLADGIPSGQVAFHPLSENLVRGESDVLEYLRKQMRKQVQDRLAKQMATLAIIAGDSAIHADLHPDQSELVTSVPKADEKFTQRIEQLVKRNAKLVNIYLKRAGTVRDEKFDRACIVKFPIVPDETRELHGIRFRKDDVASLDSLLDFILPGYNTEAYCIGSNSNIAPFFDALIRSYAKIIGKLNAVTKLFSDFVEDVADDVEDAVE